MKYCIEYSGIAYVSADSLEEAKRIFLTRDPWENYTDVESVENVSPVKRRRTKKPQRTSDPKPKD